MEVAGLVAKIIRDEKPAKVNIDVGGLGVGVSDRLEEQGYGGIISRSISAANPSSRRRSTRPASPLAAPPIDAPRCGST